ncbi:hypothetical protein [uncultured Methanofollis sp.]|uniref:hypothetical protein n=1 Tax=uncultured Methanofollis sp. TaxID=262500 RepID=UPI00261FE1F4|nr:hypothetical protein [uncultured Methanofollis sp.]
MYPVMAAETAEEEQVAPSLCPSAPCPDVEARGEHGNAPRLSERQAASAPDAGSMR